MNHCRCHNITKENLSQSDEGGTFIMLLLSLVLSYNDVESDEGGASSLVL